MRQNFLQIQFVLLSVGIAFSLPGRAMTCSDLLINTLATRLSAEVEDRIGSRGLLTSAKFDGKTENVLNRLLISYWGIEIYIMPSIEAARAHDRIARRPYEQGFYLIDSKADYTKINLENREKGEELFRDVLSRKPEGVFFKGAEYHTPPEERQMVVVSRERVQRDIDADGVIFRDRDLRLGPHFMRMGYFFPKDVYGVFEPKDLWASSSTFKKLMSRARKEARDGVTFEFSVTESQIREDLGIASDTERKNQNTKGNGYYTNPENVNRVVEQFNKGEAFTIRAVKGGQSLGGILVFRHGNRVDFSTTFYREDGGILYSQIAAVVLFQRLEAMGVNKLYIDMISEFSAGLKAKRASMKDGADHIAELERRAPIDYDFKTSWPPPAGGN